LCDYCDYTPQDRVIPATPASWGMTGPHLTVYFTHRLLNSKNFARSAAWADVCALLSAVLVSDCYFCRSLPSVLQMAQ